MWTIKEWVKRGEEGRRQKQTEKLTRTENQPGKDVFSGSADVYHMFQSRGYCSKDVMMPWKLVNLSNSVMLSQESSDNQVVHGLSIWFSLSRTWTGRKKNSNMSFLQTTDAMFLFWEANVLFQVHFIECLDGKHPSYQFTKTFDYLKSTCLFLFLTLFY